MILDYDQAVYCIGWTQYNVEMPITVAVQYVQACRKEFQNDSIRGKSYYRISE
jgi:hypothetical protein